jgi:hypothetical protein
MNGADAVLRSLEAEGVDVCFGIPGGAILPTYDAFARGTSVRHVLARHEQGAGHMAEGYARASGRVGVALATSGPGATNLVTPIADAWMDSTPTVFVTGQAWHPRWVARVRIGAQERNVELRAVNGFFAAAVLPPGATGLVLEFQPRVRWSWIGHGVFAGLLLLALASAWRRRGGTIGAGNEPAATDGED